MSPQAEEMLLQEVAPRLHAAIPQSVSYVASEDTQELLQDGLAMAAKILTNAHKNGKKVTPGNVAYYTLQHMKCGRRTVGYSNADVLGSATQLNGRSTVGSLDQEVRVAEEFDGALPVAEIICRDEEDPATKAARNLDWQEFIAAQDPKDQAVLECIAEGRTAKESSAALNLSITTVRIRLNRLRRALLEFFGEGVIRDSNRKPQWFHDMRTAAEQFACRSGRSWQMQ